MAAVYLIHAKLRWRQFFRLVQAAELTFTAKFTFNLKKVGKYIQVCATIGSYFMQEQQ